MPNNTQRKRRRKRASAIAQRRLPMNLPHATYADLSKQETAGALRRSALKDLRAAEQCEQALMSADRQLQKADREKVSHE